MVLTGMPRPVLGESCITSIKDFAIFPPPKKKVRTLCDKLHCDLCIYALKDESQENDEFAQLIESKTHGGLVYPSKGVILICQGAEKIFR